jgi:hypothetical protein
MDADRYAFKNLLEALPPGRCPRLLKGAPDGDWDPTPKQRRQVMIISVAALFWLLSAGVMVSNSPTHPHALFRLFSLLYQHFPEEQLDGNLSTVQELIKSFELLGVPFPKVAGSLKLEREMALLTNNYNDHLPSIDETARRWIADR